MPSVVILSSRRMKFVVSRRTRGNRDCPSKFLGSGTREENARLPLTCMTWMSGLTSRSRRYAEGGMRRSWMFMYLAKSVNVEATMCTISYFCTN